MGCTPRRHQGCSPLARRRGRDRGVTLIEILVTVVLMGIGVSAILVALRTTTAASAVDEEHAVAFTWLQAASDEIYRTPRTSCYGLVNASEEIRAIYAAAIQPPNVPAPDSWPSPGSASITVTGVQFLGRPSFDTPYEWGETYCFEGPDYDEAEQYTQRVTIQVTTPRGMTKTLQMVKGQS
ncbi:MAG: type II secretion system protein [Acidimicrobiia bacterium]